MFNEQELLSLGFKKIEKMAIAEKLFLEKMSSAVVLSIVSLSSETKRL